MVDVSDECIAQLDELNADAINWCAWEVEGKETVIAGSGSGGLSELKDFLYAEEQKVYFGAFLVYGIDDRGTTVSKRFKVSAFSWTGKGLSVLKKARVSVQRNDIFNKIPGAATTFMWEFEGDDTDPITHEEVKKSLLACGGAHKPTHYDFGDGTVLAADFYHTDDQ